MNKSPKRGKATNKRYERRRTLALDYLSPAKQKEFKNPHFCVCHSIAGGIADNRQCYLRHPWRSGLSRSGHRQMPFLGGVQLSLRPRRLSLSARKAQSAGQGIAAARRRSAQAHGAVAWAVSVSPNSRGYQGRERGNHAQAADRRSAAIAGGSATNLPIGRTDTWGSNSNPFCIWLLCCPFGALPRSPRKFRSSHGAASPHTPS